MCVSVSLCLQEVLSVGVGPRTEAELPTGPELRALLGRVGEALACRKVSPTHRTGPDRTGPDHTGPDRAGTHRTGPHRTGLDWTGPDRTGPDHTGPEHTYIIEAQTFYSVGLLI